MKKLNDDDIFSFVKQYQNKAHKTLTMFSRLEDIERVFTTKGFLLKDFPFLFSCHGWKEKYTHEENLETLRHFIFCSDIAKKRQRKKHRKEVFREKRYGVNSQSKYKNKWNKTNDDFYRSFEWVELRKDVIKTYGAVCMKCGASKSNSVKIHVDHIKPRSIYPNLELRFDNLQVLCARCNRVKSNIDETDFRKEKKEIWQ